MTVLKMKHLCEYCGKQFTRAYSRNKHSEKFHGGIVFTYNCVLCSEDFKNRRLYNEHMKKHINSNKWFTYREAFKGVTKIFRKNLENTTSFLQLYLLKKDIRNLIEQQLLGFPKLKMNISVCALFKLENENSEAEQLEEFTFKSDNYIVTLGHRKEIEAHVVKCLNQLRTREDQLNLNESGWILIEIAHIDLHFTEVNILL